MTRIAGVADTVDDAVASRRPPGWLFVATGLLGVVILAMAVAETNLWLHYLIDGGEYVSIAGLVFIAVVGVGLHRSHRLTASLPLMAPWLLFPVITQGDQIIDNLSINPMRAVTHVLLAAIFAMPVGVVVLAARAWLGSGRVDPRSPLLAVLPGLRPLADGRTREGTTLLTTTLFVLEMWVAVRFLGLLMVVTLVAMTLAVLWWGSMSAPRDVAEASARRARSERNALVLLMVGVAMSFGLYVGYKNRPGAYQGSPSFLMDPQQKGSGYPIDRVPVPSGPVAALASPQPLHAALTTYGHTLRRMLDGYYILDRNYTYDFHNELFMRHTPLMANYRAVGLRRVAEARAMKHAADTAADTARATLPSDHPLAALLDDVRTYVDFNFGRAARLESMSGEFERTKAGLQHAAHLYEGEGKVLGMVLNEILTKHQRAIASPAGAAVAGEFATEARGIYRQYADRVVGF